MKHLQMLLQMFESELRWESGHDKPAGDARQKQLGYMSGIAHARELVEALITAVPEDE